MSPNTWIHQAVSGPCPYPALLLLLLGLLLFETAHTGVAGGAGEAGDTF